MLREGGGVEKDPGGAAGTARGADEGPGDEEERAWNTPGLGQLCACPDALSESKTKPARSDVLSQLYSPRGSMDGDFNTEKVLSIRAGECCRKALWSSRKGRACGRKLGCEAQPHPFLCV